MAARYTFTIDQGATEEFTVVYTDCNDVPIDLAGYTAEMHIRPAPGSPTLYAELSTVPVSGSGLYLTGLPSENYPLSSGTIGVVMSAAMTESFNFGEASYDLELYKDDRVIRVIEGKIRLNREVTKRGE
jgi:hypothetical protein